jgi:hypothetical protein
VVGISKCQSLYAGSNLVQSRVLQILVDLRNQSAHILLIKNCFPANHVESRPMFAPPFICLDKPSSFMLFPPTCFRDLDHLFDPIHVFGWIKRGDVEVLGSLAPCVCLNATFLPIACCCHAFSMSSKIEGMSTYPYHPSLPSCVPPLYGVESWCRQCMHKDI